MSPFKIKYRWADKVSLLMLLIAGLLIAHLISVGRSVVKFSKPVELEYMGVRAAVPIGNGWESDKQWAYEENKFVLSSFFSPGQSSPIAVAHYRYLLGVVDVNASEQIQEKVLAVGGTISEEGTIKAGEVKIDWAQIKVPATGARIGFGMLFGCGVLPGSRVVNIEVRWSEQDAEEMAKKVFRRMARGLEFKGSSLLEDGAKIIRRMKEKGLGQFLTEQNRQNYFVIKDDKGKAVGYVINIFTDLGYEVPMNIQAASSSYIRGSHGREEVTIFQCRDDMSEFVYKSETVSRFGRSGIEGVFDRAGVLAVKEYGTFISGKGFRGADVEPYEERFYRPGAASMPDILSELIYDELLESEYGRILIDVVRTDGTILPVVISRVKGGDSNERKAAYAYELRLDFLDRQGSYSQVYLDKNKMTLKEIFHRGGTYVLERSSPTELRKLIPEKSGEIFKYEK